MWKCFHFGLELLLLSSCMSFNVIKCLPGCAVITLSYCHNLLLCCHSYYKSAICIQQMWAVCLSDSYIANCCCFDQMLIFFKCIKSHILLKRLEDTLRLVKLMSTSYFSSMSYKILLSFTLWCSAVACAILRVRNETGASASSLKTTWSLQPFCLPVSSP